MFANGPSAAVGTAPGGTITAPGGGPAKIGGPSGPGRGLALIGSGISGTPCDGIICIGDI
jgi:hypothetical protein